MPSITETTLRFTGGYPPLPVLALAFGLAALMWWLYGRESRFASGPLAKLPALLRSLAVFVLVMALAGPVLRHVTTLRQLGRVVIAVDGSASMQLTDEGAEKSSTQTKSRYQRAEDLLLKGTTPLLKKLAETQDVELVALRGNNTQRLWWRRQGGKDTSGELPASFDLPATTPITNLDQCFGPRDGGHGPRRAHRWPAQHQRLTRGIQRHDEDGWSTGVHHWVRHGGAAAGSFAAGCRRAGVGFFEGELPRPSHHPGQHACRTSRHGADRQPGQDAVEKGLHDRWKGQQGL
jgi:hypothetical protein